MLYGQLQTDDQKDGGTAEPKQGLPAEAVEQIVPQAAAQAFCKLHGRSSPDYAAYWMEWAAQKCADENDCKSGVKRPL